MNENTKYNGWTNYTTWRINLEFGFGDGGYENASSEMLQEIVFSVLEETANGLGLDYAQSFISDVNWGEIAESLEDNE